MPPDATVHDAGVATSVLPGVASGPVLCLSEGLSFWGGVDPATGTIADRHHPEAGRRIAGTVLTMPTSRGSCTGSGVLLDLILNGKAPAALIFRETEDILTLGALIAARLFDRPLPVLRADDVFFTRLAGARRAEIGADSLTLDGKVWPLSSPAEQPPELTAADRAMLEGAEGEAARIAMEMIRDMARLQGARDLVDVTRAHIDGCTYACPALLTFAEVMAAKGARTRVPTTMNAISVCHDLWQAQGVPPAFGQPATRLADTYVGMGAEPTFTCAPYLLASPPAKGEFIGWSELNAVVYANSVLGARTHKHPDFFDLCIAVTGRAPRAGAFLDAGRRPAWIIHVTPPSGYDDALWPMLGYLAGTLSPDRVPLLTGLEGTGPTTDDLKALCAAFGTTSAAPMLHIRGVTPEADLPPLPGADRATIGKDDLAALWHQFNDGPPGVDLVAFGSPHLSLDECRAVAHAVEGRTRAKGVQVILTCGPATRAAAAREGLTDRLSAFGAQLLSDICWCMITEPLFPAETTALMTSSGKLAHYGPGLVGRPIRFGSLADCLRAAETGRAPDRLPAWLN